jgi:uncharacterized protein (DUF983 family)
MRVTVGQILARGFLHQCPNCGGRTLFKNWFTANERCARCGLKFEREDGFFLGALVINYTVTSVLLLVPLLVLVFREQVGITSGVIAAVVWCIVFPLIFFPTSKSLWLRTYYLCFPRQLPANGGRTGQF